MNTKSIVLLFLFGIITTNFVFAQDSTATVQEEVYSEVDLLKMQLEMQREQNELLVRPMWYAVTGLISLVAGGLIILGLIVGLNVWQYNSRYVKDMKALEENISDQLKNKTKTAEDNLKAELLKRYGELEESVNSKVGDIDKLVRARVNAEFIQISTRLDKITGEVDRLRFLGLHAEIAADQENKFSTSSEYKFVYALELLQTGRISKFEKEDFLSITKIFLNNRIKNAIKPVFVSYEEFEDALKKIEGFDTEIEELVGLVLEWRKKAL